MPVVSGRLARRAEKTLPDRPADAPMPTTGEKPCPAWEADAGAFEGRRGGAPSAFCEQHAFFTGQTLRSGGTSSGILQNIEVDVGAAI